ncbi:DUF6506 family protein [Nocardiopsis ganjiahuensis]|uniref:DUF6506 family protein n=1 Tax=Nocardiopsis ganjiahuensis TaxID=239984 RepID=UPI0003456639|nr:DUF6506 family protein [Nocardiopsis ganjiahuensis]
MSVTWAYLYEHPDTDPVADRTEIDRAGQRTILVPVADSAAAPGIAAGLAEEGAALIELCGGFSLEAAAAVRAAAPAHVAIGHVVFSAESVRAAAAYSEAASS